MTIPTSPCPSCAKPLFRVDIGRAVVVWCGNGECEGVASNHHAVGHTLAVAVQNLADEIEQEKLKKL